MKIEKTSLNDCVKVYHKVFNDERGSFKITYNSEMFKMFNIDDNWLQENESLSKKWTIRGMHIQKNKPQGKLVSVKSGAITDVVIDLRKDSSTYLRHESFEISEYSNFSLYIPPGFAHGFLAKNNGTCVSYKINTNTYAPDDEISINPFGFKYIWEYNDNFHMSEKDKNGLTIDEYISL